LFADASSYSFARRNDNEGKWHGIPPNKPPPAWAWVAGALAYLMEDREIAVNINLPLNLFYKNEHLQKNAAAAAVDAAPA
jgi:hypothetical protein